MSEPGKFKVTEASYHRNGVGGEGFVVAIVESDGRRMLCIDFAKVVDEDNYEHDIAFDYAFAAIDLDEAARGNVYSHDKYDADANPVPGTGNNAWRGDEFAIEWRAAIHAAVEEQSELFHTHLRKTGQEREI